MIPEFPKFKPLELSDKKDVEKFTLKFPPYSDFNFVSMWSWDIRGEMRISQMHGNLVVRFTDYLTGEPFYSFLGNNKTSETVEALIQFSKDEGLKSQLQLVPEISAKDLDTSLFEINEDRSDFDYIYSVEDLTRFEGAKHSNSRRLIRNFLKNEAVSLKNLDLAIENDRQMVLQLDHAWKKNREFNFNNENEDKALLKLLDSAPHLSLMNIGVFVGGELVAFTLNEKINDGYAMSSFAKFDIKYHGSYLYSMKATSEKLKEGKCQYINCEQDLGLPGLRYSKEALGPAFYLKKYTVKKRC